MMRFSGYLATIDFYADKNDSRSIFCEFEIPGDGVTIPSREKFVRITDPVFLSYLRTFILPKMKKKISEQKILQEITDYFLLNGNDDCVSPRVRTAGNLQQELIECDLYNNRQQYVCVTPDGWKITSKHSHKFLKPSIALPQIAPVESSKSLLELMKPYVNVKTKDELILLCAWLVQAFCEGNHSALLIMAGRGCGKSFLTKRLRDIIDPSQLQTCTMPDKSDAFITTLTNSYVVAFDNSAELSSKEQSDVLCAAITGATVAKRVLFTTNDLGVFDLHNTVILNGIDILPSQSDLAQRCLLMNLKQLDESSRKSENGLRDAFENDRAEILGAIFSTLSKAMTEIKKLPEENLPRMADTYQEMLAIAIALGVSADHFRNIYDANVAALNKARACIAIVEAISDFMASSYVSGRKAYGTVSEIYQKVKETYSGSKSDLPKSPSHFSRKLNAEHETLYSAGYSVQIDDTKADATYVEIIRK